MAEIGWGILNHHCDLQGDDAYTETYYLFTAVADRPPHHLETSVPGVFVAGDVRAESAKRVAAAVGEGSMAVMFVHRHLAEA